MKLNYLKMNRNITNPPLLVCPFIIEPEFEHKCKKNADKVKKM